MMSQGAPPLATSPLSAILATMFRGNLCDTILQDRRATLFAKDVVIYDLGEASRTLFFIRSGFVKVETITKEGHALIYDVRKAGDVVGELCAFTPTRQDRAVTLEPAEVTAVPFDDVLAAIQKNRNLLGQLLRIFCGALSEAYEHLNSVAFSGTAQRLVKVLVRLGRRVGRPSPHGIELSTRLTQEELAQMAAVSREKVSTAMNVLRAHGLVDYSRGGHIVLDLPALEAYAEGDTAPERLRDDGAGLRIGGIGRSNA